MISDQVGARSYRERLQQLAGLIGSESDGIRQLALHEMHNVLRVRLGPPANSGGVA